jgi:hypothetical protein
MNKLISLFAGFLLMFGVIGSAAGAPPIPITGDTTPIAWDTSAGGFKGETGRTYRFSCPADGTAAGIYGSDVYTDDSSICTAAVHAGIISIEHGGTVTIEIRPGRSTYGSTTRHGIKSMNWGEYPRSFVFNTSGASQDGRSAGGRNSRPDADNDESADVTPIGWDTSAGGFKGEAGQTYRFSCPAAGTAAGIYGSDVYTDDSSICTAAVHAGSITRAQGGMVTIEIRPGRSTYGSTLRHGIKSMNWGEYPRSFVVR